METIEIRSKSYVIKWVDAVENSTIHYEIKPLKKSIGVSVYTYKEGESPLHQESNSSKNGSSLDIRRRSSTVNSATSPQLTLEQRLSNAHLIIHSDLGRLNGDELSKGEIVVSKPNVFAFVFDNTFSKTTGKKVLFTQYSDHENKKENFANYRTSIGDQVPPVTSTVPYLNNRLSSSTSSLSFHKKSLEHTSSIKFDLPELDDKAVLHVKGGRYLQGFLLKKKRKKTGKNFNKRFFTLNFKYGVLNYYLNDNSKHVRGNMFIKYVGITADVKTRIIVLDSGLEIWTLKATSDEDLHTWVNAFNAIKQQSMQDNEDVMEQDQSFQRTIIERDLDESSVNFDNTHELLKDLEVLHLKIEGLKSKSAYLTKSLEFPVGERVPSTSSIATTSSQSVSRKSSFWKKKRSDSPGISTKENDSSSDILNKPLSSAGAVKYSRELQEELVETNNMVLQLINKQEFHALNNQKTSFTGNSGITTAANSVFSQEFFDANEYVNELNSGVLMVNHNDSELNSKEDLQLTSRASIVEEEGSSVDTDLGDNMSTSSEEAGNQGGSSLESLEPTISEQEQDLYPLTSVHEKIKRRKDIQQSQGAPPSILSFVRKNIGKDLSTISMPVTANEPLTMLQKYSEVLEYCTILHGVPLTDLESGARILKVAVFATSYLSSLRSKERNNRKPFNPLLGETYELVREDLGMRLISEKVCHRPQVFAMYADSDSWSFQYSPSPAQKFWSKNAEVINKGTVKLTFKSTGEVYQWSQPTSLLKNIIAGEKYTEPSSSLTVTSSTGQRAVVDFKQGGMFSGRSEDLTITAVDKQGKKLPSQVVGTWTEKLVLKKGSAQETVWEAGQLVSNSNKKYGFTEFAASLNEITPIEEGKLAPTDSRLRPDLQKYEIGQVDEAESLKLKLEQDQRDRRNNGDVYVPLFFNKINDEKYEIKKGEANYWERRKKGNWDGLLKLW